MTSTAKMLEFLGGQREADNIDHHDGAILAPDDHVDALASPATDATELVDNNQESRSALCP